MNTREGLYNSVRALSPLDSFSDTDARLTQSARNFHFAMRCNGYVLGVDDRWRFKADTLKPFLDEFTGQKVAFFGVLVV